MLVELLLIPCYPGWQQEAFGKMHFSQTEREERSDSRKQMKYRRAFLDKL
jgi:hypothetical protein